MRVLFLAAEAAPLVKVGGLGDVAGELPRALRGQGIDVRLALPRYPQLEKQVRGQAPLVSVEIAHPPGELRATVHATTLRGVPTWLVGGDPISRVAAVYGPDPHLDASKFAFFAVSALHACRTIGWDPEVVHAHDWHTAPALAWMRATRQGWEKAATVLTIHNLAFMGAGGSDALSEYGIPPADDAALPGWARSLALPIGMASADRITTVSPSYAAEIQTPEFGFGLEGYLASRAGTLHGILNGIDPELWDPARDPCLCTAYTSRSLAARSGNKSDLQRAVGLPVEARTPLLGMITRLDAQKGVDLAIDAMSLLPDRPWQLVLLGTGDAGLEARAHAFQARSPERVRFLPTYDFELACRIYGGADAVLVPSRYEPCGLVQMIAMRYGAVPIVRSTGGLKDTVMPYTPKGEGTGFVFGPAEPRALAEAIAEALGIYADQDAWAGLQQRGMAKDFSWDRSARAYAALYREAAAARAPERGGAR